MAKKQVSGERFVTAIIQGHKVGSDLLTIAESLGMTRGSVQCRASKYRSMGIPLPKFPRGGGKRVDIHSLIDLADSLLNGGK